MRPLGVSNCWSYHQRAGSSATDGKVTAPLQLGEIKAAIHLLHHGVDEYLIGSKQLRLVEIQFGREAAENFRVG